MSTQTMATAGPWVVVTFMQINNEKEQAEKGKVQNVEFGGKRNIRKYSRVKSNAQGEKSDSKWNKGSGDLRERPHLAKFSTSEKAQGSC